VLGIDYGIANVGWCVIEIFEDNSFVSVSHGTLTTNKEELEPDRYRKIRQGIRDIIRQYNPYLIVIEGFAYSRRASNIFQLGEVVGILKTVCDEEHILHFTIPATVGKKFITGRGNATKEEVKKAVECKCNIKFSNTHEADACVYALIGAELMLRACDKSNRWYCVEEETLFKKLLEDNLVRFVYLAIKNDGRCV